MSLNGLIRWAVATALGESAGMMVSALLGAFLSHHLGSLALEADAASLGAGADGAASSATSAALNWLGPLLVPLGGLAEGVCLGAMQSWALGRAGFPISGRRWTLATAVAMALGWAVAAPVGEWAAGIGLNGLASVGLVLGCVIGMVLGLVQSLAINTSAQTSPANGPPAPASEVTLRWVVASTLAWSVGMVVSGIGSSLIPAGAWSLGHFLQLAATGLATGACVGAMTGAGWLSSQGVRAPKATTPVGPDRSC